MNSTTITQEETQDNISMVFFFFVFDHIAEAQIDNIIEYHLSQPI